MVKHLTTIGVVVLCVTVASIAPAADLVIEDWETSPVGFGSWVTSSGNGMQSVVSNYANHTAGGQYSWTGSGGNVSGNNDANVDNITTQISTLGETRVNVMMWYRLDNAGDMEDNDFLQISYSTDGANFTPLWTIYSGDRQDWWQAFVTLPADAVNVANVWVRITMDDSSSAEEYCIDDIYIGDAMPSIGNVYREIYMDDGGGGLGDFDWRFPNYPEATDFLSGSAVFETPTNWADNYGQRLRAFVVPPTTGDYTFWVVTDDNSYLAISPDEDPRNAVQIADTSGWAPSRNWGHGNVHPGTVNLTGGQRYYVEVVMKEGGGGDNLAVGWQGPGISGDTERPIPVSRFVSEMPVQSVTRSMPAMYTPTVAFTVTLDVIPGMTAAGSLSVTETVVPGAIVTLSNPVVPAGVTPTISGNQITFDAANVNGQYLQMSYDVTIGGCAVVANVSGSWAGGILSGSVAGPGSILPIGQGTGASPIPWSGNADIGAVGAPGYSDWFNCANVYLLGGAGADVWGTGDECQFLYLQVAGDFTIAGEFEFINTVNTWTKMGLMLRASLDPTSPTITTNISDNDAQGTNAQTFNVQTRLVPGGMSSSSNLTNWESAYLVMSRDVGATQTRIACLGDPDDDYGSWHGLRQTILSHLGNTRQVTVPNTDTLAGNVYVGLFIVGHQEPLLANGLVSNVLYTPNTILGTDVTVYRDLPSTGYLPGGPVVPVRLFVTPYDTQAGTVVATETLPAGWIANVTAVAGGSVTGTGTGQLVWTVTTTTGTRQLNYNAVPSLAACGPFQPDGKYDYGSVVSVLGTGIQITSDQWIGQFPLPTDVISNPACPIPWVASQDVGPVNPNNPGATAWFQCDDRYEILASGADIWGGTDEMHYLWLYVRDDFQIQADVSWPVRDPFWQPVNGWSKAGIFVRESTAGNAANYGVLIRWNNGDRLTRPQWRDSAGAGSGGVYFTNDLYAGPQWPVTMGLSRTGSVITGWADEAITAAPAESHSRDMPNIRPVCVLGFGVTSHDDADGQYSVARFENVVANITPYMPTISGPTRSVVQATATVGQPLDVVVTVPHLANASTVTVVENLPPDLLPITVPAGGTINGQTVSIPIAPFNQTTSVTYQVLPLWSGAYVPYAITSGWAEDDAGWAENTAPSVTVPHTGTIAIFQQGVWPDPSYAGTADTHIIKNTPDTDQGGWVRIEQGDWHGSTSNDFAGLDDHKSILIRFDVSSVAPATVPTIDHASLGLYFEDDRRDHGNWVEPHQIRAWKSLRQWNEGDDNASDGGAAVDGEATWNSARHNQEAWSLPGAMDVTDVDANAEPWKWWSSKLPQWVALDVTRTAKEMVATSATNFGWKVSQDRVVGVPWDAAGNGFARGAWDAASRQNGNALVRPILVLMDNTRFPGMVQSATRSIVSGGAGTPATPGVWIYGADRISTVSLTLVAAAAGNSVVIRDSVPAGWEIVSVLDGGSTTAADSMEWTISPWTMAGATVRYTCRNIGWTTTDLIPPPALWTNGTYVEDVAVSKIPDSNVLHIGTAALQKGVWPDSTYVLCQDAHVTVNRSDGNMGGEVWLEEGHWGAETGDHKKILVEFGVPPTGVPGVTGPADIVEAEVLFYYFRDRANNYIDHTLRAQRVLQPWIEGTGYSGGGTDGVPTALAGEVTWNSSAHTVSTWGIPGLMLGGTDASNFGIPSNVFGSQRFVWVHVDVTNDVIAALSGTRTFSGWKVSQDKVINVPDNDASNPYTTGDHAADLVSMNHWDAVHRPMLLIKTPSYIPVEVTRFYLY